MKDVILLQGLVGLVGGQRAITHVVCTNPAVGGSSGHASGHVNLTHEAVLWVAATAKGHGLGAVPFPTIPRHDRRYREGYAGFIVNGWDVLLPGVSGSARAKLDGYPVVGDAKARGARAIVEAVAGKPAAPGVVSTAFLAGGTLEFARAESPCLRSTDVVYRGGKPRRISDLLRVTVKRRGRFATLLFLKHHASQILAVAFEDALKAGDVIFENSAVSGGQSAFDHFEHLYDLLKSPPPPAQRLRPEYVTACMENVGGRVTCLGCIVRE